MSLDDFKRVEGAAHAAQHAEAQHIDLHEFQRVDIILVPFDDLPVFHRGGLDRHQFVEPVEREHEAARMLREMARRADQLPRQLERQPQAAVLGLRLSSFSSASATPSVLQPQIEAGERAGDVFGQAQRLADFAHRAARAIARDDRGQRRARAAIGLVNPLDDFLAPLVLEIDIDIGRLAALFGDEALEQQALAHGIDRGDAEHVADGGIGGRAAALAENALGAREADDGIHRQEVRRIFHALDQVQLMAQLRRDVVGQAFRIALRRAFPGQLFQPLLRVRPSSSTSVG